MSEQGPRDKKKDKENEKKFYPLQNEVERLTELAETAEKKITQAQIDCQFPEEDGDIQE